MCLPRFLSVPPASPWGPRSHTGCCSRRPGRPEARPGSLPSLSRVPEDELPGRLSGSSTRSSFFPLGSAVFPPSLFVLFESRVSGRFTSDLVVSPWLSPGDAARPSRLLLIPPVLRRFAGQRLEAVADRGRVSRLLFPPVQGLRASPRMSQDVWSQPKHLTWHRGPGSGRPASPRRSPSPGRLLVDSLTSPRNRFRHLSLPRRVATEVSAQVPFF